MILRNAIVAGVGPVLIQQSAGKFVHLEEVSFSFDEVEWEYTPFDENGKASVPVRAGWNVMKNKAL
jgi:type VI protein secretion system component Hcp